MLDFRAWLFAGLILLAAATSYIVWIRRPHAVTNARSLSAGQPHPSTNNLAGNSRTTQNLHVEGCQEDFITTPGELIEPLAVPNPDPAAYLAQLRNTYGPENSLDNTSASENSPAWHSATWNAYAYDLTALPAAPTANPPSLPSLQLKLNPGHVLETLDGIELGIDSFGAIYRKMRDKKVELHERITHNPQSADNPPSWTLTVSLFSACSKKFRSQYTRTLPATPEIDHQIQPAPSQTGTQPAPYRSSIFMNKVVTEYTILPSNGHDDSPTGTPSEHN